MISDSSSEHQFDEPTPIDPGSFSVERLASFDCKTGENPRLDPRDGSLWWTDIPRGLIFRFDPNSGQSAIVYRGPVVGGFEPWQDGWLLAREHDVVWWDGGDRFETWHAFEEPNARRFNDLFHAGEGVFFAGTIAADADRGLDATQGGLYRFTRDEAPRALRLGTGVGNGMALSADGTSFFWTDSTHRQLWRWRFEAGELHGQAQLWWQGPERDEPGHGVPDGLLLRPDGALLSARNKGSALVVHEAQSGRAVHFFAMPTAKITAVCAGAERGEYYLTSGGGQGQDESGQHPNDAGALFRLRTGANA